MSRTNPSIRFEKWSCPICFESNSHPCNLVPCGHGACYTCCQQLKECHICKDKITDTVTNWDLATLNGIEVKTNKKRGCSSVEELRNNVKRYRRDAINSMIREVFNYISEQVEKNPIIEFVEYKPDINILQFIDRELNRLGITTVMTKDNSIRIHLDTL